MSPRHDVVVVGAGPGGSATAYYLAMAGLDVLLLDKSDFPRDKTCGDGLTPRALAVAADMGVLDRLAAYARRVDRLDIVAPGGRRVSAPIEVGPGMPDFALVVPRQVLDDTLRRRAVEAGATFRAPFQAEGIDRDDGGVAVRGKEGGKPAKIRAHVAVVATGAGMGLLRSLAMLPVKPGLMLAARAYYEGLPPLDDAYQIRFDRVPLPGYGWVFPLPGGAANIGLGFYTGGRRRNRLPATAQGALAAFLDSPGMRPLMAGARAAGPVAGFPLRVDFGYGPVQAPRLLLVGEAAGLVNPLSGEGVDYALESGRLAAEHLTGLFARSDFSGAAFEGYEAVLRRRFETMFRFCNRVRDLCLNRLVLDRLAALAENRSDLKERLVGVVFGSKEAPAHLSTARFLRTVVAGGLLGPRRL